VKQQPLWLAPKKPRKPAIRRPKEELDALAEEFRQWRFRSIHIAMIVFEDDKEFYNRKLKEGQDLYNMTLVQVRKLPEYKSYVREFHKK
jgi:hypothetical protein